MRAVVPHPRARLRRLAAAGVLAVLAVVTTVLVAPMARAATEHVCEIENATLHRGDGVRSCGAGRYTLHLQTADGNLVLIENSSGRAVWSAGVSGRGVDRVAMQADGHLVAYAGSTSVWFTNTDGHPGARLTVQDDGNTVIHSSSGAALWSSQSGLLTDRGETTRGPAGTNCESSFVVEGFNGEASIAVASAGHCDTPGKGYARVEGNNDFELVNVDINYLNAPTVVGGQELRSANHFRRNWKNGDVFVSDNRDDTVHPTAIGAVDNRVCRYGGVSPTACGNIVRDDYAPTFVRNAYGFYLLDIPCSPGDSGSAVLSEDGTRAVGIVSGRRVRDRACIVARLDQLLAGSGLRLYDPPALNTRFRLYYLLNGAWTQIGQGTSDRAKCIEVAEAGGRRGHEFRCLPV